MRFGRCFMNRRLLLQCLLAVLLLLLRECSCSASAAAALAPQVLFPTRSGVSRAFAGRAWTFRPRYSRWAARCAWSPRASPATTVPVCEAVGLAVDSRRSRRWQALEEGAQPAKLSRGRCCVGVAHGRASGRDAVQRARPVLAASGRARRRDRDATVTPCAAGLLSLEEVLLRRGSKDGRSERAAQVGGWRRRRGGACGGRAERSRHSARWPC
jgi:hypothetical protein